MFVSLVYTRGRQLGMRASQSSTQHGTSIHSTTGRDHRNTHNRSNPKGISDHTYIDIIALRATAPRGASTIPRFCLHTHVRDLLIRHFKINASSNFIILLTEHHQVSKGTPT